MSIEQSVNKDLILREKLALQRTVLANQTTFLAFLRTSMYFLIAGLSIRSLLKAEGNIIFEYSFYIISLLLLIFGVLNFFRQKSLINKSKIHIGYYKAEYLAD